MPCRNGYISELLTEQDNDSKTYLIEQDYYPYYGAGHIQLTHEYNYLSFALYIGLQKYPQFADSVKLLSPANNDTGKIRTEYDNLKKEAENAGINIEDITKIVEPSTNAANYVAENYEWETVGFFWDNGGVNDIIENLIPGDKYGIDKVTDIVNKYAPDIDRNERREKYEEFKEVLK